MRGRGDGRGPAGREQFAGQERKHEQGASAKRRFHGWIPLRVGRSSLHLKQKAGGVFYSQNRKFRSRLGETRPCSRFQCRPKYLILTDYPSCFFTFFLLGVLRWRIASHWPSSEKVVNRLKPTILNGLPPAGAVLRRTQEPARMDFCLGVLLVVKRIHRPAGRGLPAGRGSIPLFSSRFPRNGKHQRENAGSGVPL